jgi:hypothetical protein
MSTPQRSDSEPLTWDISPTDFRVTALLRYLPFVFFGGYVGILLIVGALTLPGLLDNPELLALGIVLLLVGGPMSLLYLWPLIRDPDQRVGLDPRGWYEGMRPAGVLAAAAVGTVVMAAGSAVAGGATHFLGLFVFMILPFFALGIVDGEGRVDPEAGTLAVGEHDSDLDRIDGVRSWRVGAVVLVWLDYVAGTSGPRPRLFAVPPEAADEILDVLQAGARADSDTEPRDPDRIAQATLVVMSLLFVAVAIGVSVTATAERARTVITLISGGLGLCFLLAAKFAA